MKIIYVLAQKTKDYFKPIAAFATEEQTKKWVENNTSDKERCDFVIQPLQFNPTGTGFIDK